MGDEQAYKNLNLLAVQYGSWEEDIVLFSLVLVNSCNRKQAYSATVIQTYCWKGVSKRTIFKVFQLLLKDNRNEVPNCSLCL